MCRAIDDGGRRCPCSAPERRSAADRARYAARKAATATLPPRGHTVPVAPPVVTPAEIRAKIDTLQAALNEEYPPRNPDVVPEDERRQMMVELDQKRFAAIDDLMEWTGASSPEEAKEQAVTKLGAMVAERAELHAGITADQVQASWISRSDQIKAKFDDLQRHLEPGKHASQEAMDRMEEARVAVRRAEIDRRPAAEIDDLRAEYKRLGAEYSATHRAWIDAQHDSGYFETSMEVNRIETGSDDQTKADLTRLAEGYKKALAEIRPTGGELNWHAKTAKKAIESFTQNAQVYPTEWIEASNARPAPIGKISRSRAHYVDAKYAKTRKKQPVVRPVFMDEQDAPELRPEPRYRLEPTDEVRYGQRLFKVHHYEVYSQYQHRTKADGTPVGPGWEHVTYTRDGREYSTWRRPKSQMITIDSEVAPEITTGGSDETSMHELAHRMESSVPQIGQMEARWVRRRTTTNGERDKKERYHATSRSEFVRPDDFINRYIGKDYETTTYHEVLSMGAPMLFTGDRGGMTGVGRNKRDDDMRAFILGCLASAKAPERVNKGIQR